MQKTVLAVLFSALLTLTACQSESAPPVTTVEQAPSAGENGVFSAYSKNFIKAFWQQYPEYSAWAGYGKYDDIISIPNQANRTEQRAFLTTQLTTLRTFDLNLLNNNNKIDYYLIENAIQKRLWELDTFQSYKWNPAAYNIAGGFATILNSRFKSLDEKYQLILNRLQYVPDYYAAAKSNIDRPTLEYTQLGIAQNQGVFTVLNDEVLKQLPHTALSDAQQQLFKQRFAAAIAAVNDYINFLQALEQELAATGTARSFRLGEALYEEKFALDIQSSYSAKQMYHKALEDKVLVTEKMREITDQLWPTYFADTSRPEDDSQAIAMLIRHLSAKHVKRENFVSEIRQQLPTLEAFVIDHDLIEIDPEKPLVVRETPAYMRGFSGASVSSPGPYEKKENTYYNVTPLDDMSAEQAESYLREYNHWILQILNIHEAIPGHYTQLVYANNAASIIKTVFRNGAMIEGWANYTERMMLEEGYGDFEPELWLMYYKWNLRVICNTILDYAIHVNDLSRDDALDLLMNGAFQERAEAEGKWRRATLSQVQLTSYYSGYREIYDFREQQKAQLGNNFDLKAFHEQFLSFGNAPVKHIKTLMQ